MHKNNQNNQSELKKEPFFPLYSSRCESYDLGRHIRKAKKKTHNTGLWYEKFCDQWTFEHDGKIVTEVTLGNKKSKWIETVTRHEIGYATEIKRANYRLQQLVEEKGGQLIRMKTISRFIPGMGRPHPVDNGINWHPTLGVPYLQGSSVKGAVRAWAESYDENKNQSDIQRIFGSDRKDPTQNDEDHSVGSIIFFDAIPAGPVRLVADVMTPHFSNYYKDPKNNSPSERENPIPIPFLAVEENQPFLFAIAPRRREYSEDMKKVIQWLKKAMFWTGAGAKTAVGYGRFEETQ